MAFNPQPITTVSLFLLRCALETHYGRFLSEEVDYAALFLLTQEDLNDLGLSTHHQERFAQGLSTLKCYGHYFAVHQGRMATQVDYVQWLLNQNDIVGTHAGQP
jgi:hypothetical protein